MSWDPIIHALTTAQTCLFLGLLSPRNQSGISKMQIWASLPHVKPFRGADRPQDKVQASYPGIQGLTRLVSSR